MAHGATHQITRGDTFDLHEELLATYPEMRELSGAPMDQLPQVTLYVSAAYLHSRIAESSLERIEQNLATGVDTQRLIGYAQHYLEALATAGDYYARFVSLESQRVEELSRRANQAIGERTRGIDGIYR